MRILITGSTGTLGKSVIQKLLADSSVDLVRCMGHSEFSTHLAEREFRASYNDPRFRFFLADIRDYDRMEFAMRDIDVVIHCAALKNLEYTEYDTEETIKTNIMGTLNLVKQALRTPSVKKFLYINSDKAVEPLSIYGCSKAVAEHTVLWGHSIARDKAFSSIRFGNIQDSRGSIVPIWQKQAAEGLPLTLTHPDASRFFIKQSDAAVCILVALDRMKGGEVFIPDEAIMPEVKMMDLVKSIGSNIVVTGLRKNEKVREKLFSDEERPFLEHLDGLPMSVIRPH